MNSRQRVLAAINHQEPDRVPLDLGGTRVSGIAATAYHRLREHLGLGNRTRVFDIYQMLAEVERPVMERLGLDVVGLNPPSVVFGIRNEDWAPWRLFDGTPTEVPRSFEPVAEPNGDLVLKRDEALVARMPKDGFYFDALEKTPGSAHVDLDTYEAPVLTDDDFEHFRLQSTAIRQNSDFAVVTLLGPPFQLFAGMGTGDFESWMLTLASEPDYVDALYEKMLAAWLKNLEGFSHAVEDRVQIIQICDDLGTQHRPFISVKMFRERIMPYYQRAFAWVHANTDMKVMMHSDGAILAMIPSLIEMGVDILNPVQTSAAGMDPAVLKGGFGDRLTFWGGSLDCQHTLPFGTPEEVAQEVEENVRVFSPGGGYVFAGVHNVQADVPPENILAMFETARAVGSYR